MGANTSRQKAAAQVRQSLVCEYEAWTLVLSCSMCFRSTERPVADLPDRWQGEKILDLLGRLKCSACRRNASGVRLEQGKRRICVTGPGSY